LEETAELMGKKANAIKALQFRALVSLRRNLGDETS
jgi:DNA-directed RNA polymerase specialized sigma24 family protein